MADNKYDINPNTGKTDTGLIIEYTGESNLVKNSPANQAAIKASKILEEEASNPTPKFSLVDGQVSVVGGAEALKHPIVAETKKALSDAFKGKDLSDKDIAASFQKAISAANEQVQSQFNYEAYEDFLKSSGFSEEAYRSYATARQEYKKPNVTTSTAAITTYDKDGKLVTKSIKDWFDYWKKEYSPEDRGVLWRQSLERAYNPTTNDDLYHAIPALLMGTHTDNNWVQGFFQWINPFDGKGAEDAPVVTPVNGFDDTNPVSVGVQTAVAEFGRILPSFLGANENPWAWTGVENGKEFFGIDDWDDKYFVDLSREDYQDLVEAASYAVKNGYDSYEKMRDEYGAETARKMWVAYTFAMRNQGGVGNGRMISEIKDKDGTVIAEPGDYPGYMAYRDMYLDLNNKTPVKAWNQSLQQSIEKFANYNPNAASLGVVAGVIGRIAAEAMALKLVSGGALSAENIMENLTSKIWRGVAGAAGVVKAGQQVASKSSAAAKALAALANGSSAGLRGASRTIYRLGQIGTWAAKEVGEDALRGIIDDALVGNSLDSQGNLDPNKLVENVYMNAVMAGFGRLPGKIGRGIGTLLDADKNIDGVKLTGTQTAQMQELADAVSKDTPSVVKNVDENGHPVITKNGTDKTLDQINLTKENADSIAPQQAATKTIEEVASADDEVRQAIGEVSDDGSVTGAKSIKTDDPIAAKNSIERKLNDNAIRRKFTNGKVIINGEEMILDVKNANLDDLASANGSTIKNIASGVNKLVDSAKQGLRSYQEAINGVLAHMDEFASNWKKAVTDFANANNVTVKDVIIALRDLRIDGEETIPGLRQLWEQNWKPTADKLLDAQDALTKIRTRRQDYYQRDMIRGSVSPDGKGGLSVNQGTIDDILGSDAEFDFTASSRKGNRQRINDEMLETDPEILAKEFVTSRVETINRYSRQGKAISVMREALEDGEELTQKEALESADASKRVGDQIRGSKEVKDMGEQAVAPDNVEMLADGFGKEDIAKLDEDIASAKKQLAEDQKKLDDLKDQNADVDTQISNRINKIADNNEKINKIEKLYDEAREIQKSAYDKLRADKSYKNGDPYPEWFTREQAKQKAKLQEAEDLATEIGIPPSNLGYTSGGNGTRRQVELINKKLTDEIKQLKEAGGTPTEGVSGDTPAVIDGHEYRTENVSDGYTKFIKDNLSDRRSNMEPVDKAANIALEQRIITPGGLADELNPGLRKGKKISPEAIMDGLDIKRLADNYYIGNARDVAEWPVWDNSNLFKLSNELLGTKFEDGVDYGYDAAKEAENAIKEKLKEAIPRALENFGNKKLDNDVTLYRVVSEGNEVNKGSIGFLKKDSGEFKNSGISYLTLDEDAVLGHPNLTGSGKKYILRIKMPKGDSISAFDRSVLTQNYGDFGEEALASSGHRAGGEFAANLDGYKFKHTGEFNKDGIEILDVYKDAGTDNVEIRREMAAAEEKVAADQKRLEDLEARKELAEKLPKDNGEPKTEAQQQAANKKTLDVVADTEKKTAEKAQDAFNKAANKSNAAREISESSKYRNRAAAQATQKPIGVNYMPGNPFGKFASWVNDTFVKSQSVQIKVGDNTYSAYSGGYSLYAEAGSWARKVIVGIRNGQTLRSALLDVLQQNGVKIEPTDYARKRYNAPTSMEKDAAKVQKIMERLTNNALYGKAVKDGVVVDTELLGSMITKELRRQGAVEFMRFLKKSNFDSFTKDQQKWLNAQAYKITASFDQKTYKGIKAAIAKGMGAFMAAKYRSNMYANLKNAQLQLTEIQRLYTLNKFGDFAKTVKRLITDADFREKVSDAAYIYASDSLGAGLSKQDLELFRTTLDSYLKTANASTIDAKGILTGLQNKLQDGAKSAIDGVDNDMLGAIQGAEYFKNYMLLAGIVQSADSKGLEGAVADAYIRNRFNTEAIAGNEVGRIGLTDSSIGRLAFMYLGFPIRELTLQAHIIKGGGTFGGSTKFDRFMGGAAYVGKMMGAKGLVWAVEAPWGYKFADVMGYDPFGVTDNRDRTADNKNVDFWWRMSDIAVQNLPFLQGAITNSFVDVYMAYRESYEDAKDEWLETHEDLSGFEWNLDDAPQDAIWQNFALGYAPGYTSFSRMAQEAGDLDRGYGISASGNRLYETNTDPGSIAWGMITGRSNTPNAMEYYQTPNPIADIQRYGLQGLGRSIERAMPFRLNRTEGPQIGFRNFREFDPIDSTSYSDWFNGSYADEQNWNTGYYAFREEAEEIRDAANSDVTQNNALEKLATRETQLADLRNRVEKYVKAYLAQHPEGISNYKMQQIQRIFNMELPEAGQQLNRALGDYDDYEKDYAENRVAQGNFPAPYGLNTPYKTPTGEITGDYSYAQSAQLKNILQNNQYGVQSNVGRVVKQLDNNLVATPYGSMSFKDFRNRVQDEINSEYSKSKVNYDRIADLQSQYLDVFDQVIRPIFETYGSGILSAGQSSDIMQQFTSMLNGLIPSEEYRVDKKGRRIRQSTPYMRVDIKKWLQKNYGNYPARNTTDNDAEARLRGIRVDMDAGRVAVARAKVLAFIEDIREGRVAVDRGRLEELQNILRGSLDSGTVTGGGNLNTRINQ